MAIGVSLALPVSLTVKAEPPKVDEIVAQSLQAEPDLQNGKMLYHNCAICHTPEGWGSATGRYPQIAGQHQSVILKQLADIQKGNRDNPTMMPFTNPIFILGPQALADLSAYIEKLPMLPNNSVGTGRELEEGEKLYNKECKECHGANGEGDAKEFYPRIHGQHYQYVLRQMQWIKMGKRRNGDEKMIEQFENFSHNDLEDIADYVSRLRPDKEILARNPDHKNPDFRPGFVTAPKVQDNQ
ncbi:MAG: c-type cytochrome [Pseudomonadota bacterium]